MFLPALIHGIAFADRLTNFAGGPPLRWRDPQPHFDANTTIRGLPFLTERLDGTAAGKARRGEGSKKMNRLEVLMMGVAASGQMFAAGTGAAASMDPAVVNAGMEHVKLENSHVRVIEGELQPGDKEQMHSHPAFVTYVIAGSKIRNNFADGKKIEAELKTGDVLYREPQTHWVENIGTTTLHFLVVELKNPG